MSPRDRVVVIELDRGLVRVCAWCTPTAKLAQLHRDHRCTDTICGSCSVRLTQEIG